MGGSLPSAAFRRFGGKPPVGLICGRGQRRKVAPAQRAGGSGPRMRATSVERAGPTTADGCTPLHRRYSHRGRRRQPSAPRFRLACDVPGGSGHFWTLLRAAMMISPWRSPWIARTDGFRLDEASTHRDERYWSRRGLPPAVRSCFKDPIIPLSPGQAHPPRRGSRAMDPYKRADAAPGSAADRLSLCAMRPRGTGWFRSSKGW